MKPTGFSRYFLRYISSLPQKFICVFVPILVRRAGFCFFPFQLHIINLSLRQKIRLLKKRALHIFLTLFISLFFGGLHAQILPSFGDSRTGTTGLQFLKIAPDARSAALSGSFSSMSDDVSSVFWNPAGLTLMDSNSWQFQFGQTSYFAGIKQNYFGAATTTDRLNFWGLQVLSLNSGSMDVTTEFAPFGTGQTFSVSNLLIGFSFGKILSDNFSFGVNAKYVNENIADIYIHNGIFDFGFIYNVGIQHNTRFAVGISNFGFNVSPSGKVVISTLNGDKEIENFENVAVPAIFRMGLSSQIWHKNYHKLVLAMQLNHPTDNNETLSFGAEYSLKNILFLRTGYEIGTDQAALPSFGVGINLQRYFGGLLLDYAFGNKDLLGNVHRITLGIKLR